EFATEGAARGKWKVLSKNTGVVWIFDHYTNRATFNLVVCSVFIDGPEYSLDVDLVTRTINGAFGIDVSPQFSLVIVGITVRGILLQIGDRKVLTLTCENNVCATFIVISSRIVSFIFSMRNACP